ncbi:MAG: ankyrin repeat domain-containing protein [Myxococcales bacterium]|nr:ankyrin repeat domain-containing protein [Myxococcales bacterium]USN50842.1 MAG: ankyrin repeat domain-containing protein [Myxococcales bacterium]
MVIKDKLFFMILLKILLLSTISCGLGETIDVLSPRDPILKAASKGDAKTLRYLVKEEGRDINYKDAAGETALHHAARWCKDGVIPVIIKLGGLANARSKNEDQAIHIASTKYGCERTLAQLVNNGADVNSFGSAGETALHKAIDLAENIDILLQNGASKNLKNLLGKTAGDLVSEELTEERNRAMRAKTDYERCLKENPTKKENCSDYTSYHQDKINTLQKMVQKLR